MAGIGGLGDLALNELGEAVAFGAGFALARVLEPAAVELSYAAWNEAPIRAPEAGLLALAVAQGKVDPGKASGWAQEEGYGGDAFAAMVAAAAVGPALGYAYTAWRRGDISEGQFRDAVKRAGVADEWADTLAGLKGERLDLGQLATAIHRGIVAGEGLLIAEPPTGAGKVPQVPPSTLDPIAEAAAHGIDQERLRILVGNTGLPLSLGEMLQLRNRGEVTDDDVKRSIAESNVRNEYMDVALALARRLLTPREYAEADLRGVMAHGDAAAGAALSGLNAEDYETLFETVGRPLAVHQLTTGSARGGDYGGTYDDVPEPYRDAIRRSNVRPEYAKLAYANRYSYPSAFVIRSLATGGELDEPTTKQTLLDIGWPPDLVDKVVQAWYGATASATDKYVGKAETQLWTTLHRSYIAAETGDADATAAMTALGVSPAAIPAVLKLWQRERALVRAQLTPAQVKKAVAEKVINPATNQPWSEQDALNALSDRGYSRNDALTFLAE